MLNKVIEMGRLTHNVEMKVSANEKDYCTFSIAVNRPGKERNKADFFNIKAWGQTARFIDEYFGKGSMIIVIGQLRTNSWTDDNGHKRSSTYILADEVQFGESKKSGMGDGPTNQSAAAFVPGGDFDEYEDDGETPF